MLRALHDLRYPESGNLHIDVWMAMRRLLPTLRRPSTYLLLACMAGLWLSFRLRPWFPLSWAIHLLFAAALTGLVYRNILGRRHIGGYFAGLLALMAVWETLEWSFHSRIQGSAALTLLDTFMDTVSGLLGAWMVARLWSRPQVPGPATVERTTPAGRDQASGTKTA